MKHVGSSGLWLSLASLGLSAPLAARQQPDVPPPSVPVVATPLAPGQGVAWQVGDTTVKIGGYVKVDLIHDFDPIDSTDSFDPRTIPTDGSDGVNTRMHAKQSRLNLDVRGPSSTDPLRFFVEGDFWGTGNAFRLRHAYGVMGSVLGGQTWTNFMDEDGMPETLDFESPIGFPQIRQAQARYTTRLESGNSYSFSIEDPASTVVGVDTTTGRVEEQMPDLTANYIWKFSRGHVQVSGFGGVSSYNPDVGAEDNVPLWGVNLSTKLKTWGDDNTILQFTYGDGVGRYRGGVTAAPDASGELEAITTAAVLASYQHFWSEKYRSTLCYSWDSGDLPTGTPLDASETLQYVAANLIWQFSDRAWTGLEYLYGTNDEFDGSDGNATRLQFAIRFNL
jgi:DcaP outer membrane protein